MAKHDLKAVIVWVTVDGNEVVMQCWEKVG
jgi:hypothetical protein